MILLPIFATLTSLVVCLPQENLNAQQSSTAQTFTAQNEEIEFKVIGYLPDYRIAKIKAKQLNAVTDVIFFGLTPNAEGEFANPDSTILKKLKKIKKANECRILVTVGGWDRSNDFSTFSQNANTRKRVIETLFEFCQRNDFDGIDYDWEHPEGADELAAYAQLVAETAEKFHEAELLVTVAQAAWQDLGKQVYESVDRIHLMTYDHEFPQATLEKSKADVLRLIDWGCPPEKIAMGLPFYGRNKKREARTYAELVAGASERKETIDPASDTINGYAFNGPATISVKVELARELKLSGVMIWELGQDADSTKESLLHVVEQQIHNSQHAEGR